MRFFQFKHIVKGFWISIFKQIKVWLKRRFYQIVHVCFSVRIRRLQTQFFLPYVLLRVFEDDIQK